MKKNLTEVIIDVIQSSSENLTVREITDIIKKRKLWFRPADNQLPNATQVGARVNRYKKTFSKENHVVTLKEVIDPTLWNVLLVNITWNPFGWRNNSYINPKAGHQYAKNNVGGESLNFKFNKVKLDDKNFVHGFVQWTNSPVRFKSGGLIIFFTRNTDENKGQIVGVYGKAEISNKVNIQKIDSQKDDYLTNIKGDKDYSILFPSPLDANNYRQKSSDRMVGQIGFSYRDESFAEQILFDELMELSNAGSHEADFDKLVSIYEFYVGKKFIRPYIGIDEKEQNELVHYYKKNKSREEIINDLKNLSNDDPKQIIVNHKAYKRDNKTIAQLKILRGSKCQICGLSIPKKDGSEYVEAAHIMPKYQKGRESPDNIILLCPNHHKEFDLGLPVILRHDVNWISFTLNKKRYKIKLSLE